MRIKKGRGKLLISNGCVQNWGDMKKGMCLETFSKLSLITLYLSPRL